MADIVTADIKIIICSNKRYFSHRLSSFVRNNPFVACHMIFSPVYPSFENTLYFPNKKTHFRPYIYFLKIITTIFTSILSFCLPGKPTTGTHATATIPTSMTWPSKCPSSRRIHPEVSKWAHQNVVQRKKWTQLRWNTERSTIKVKQWK